MDRGKWIQTHHRRYGRAAHCENQSRAQSASVSAAIGGFSSSVTADLNLIAIGIEKVNRSCLSARAPARYRSLANANLVFLEIFQDTSKVVRLDDQAKVIQVAVN